MPQPQPRTHRGELRVYVDSGYRNPEWKAVRAFLAALEKKDGA